MAPKTLSTGNSDSLAGARSEASPAGTTASLGGEDLRSVLDTAHEAFVSMDAGGCITYWNPEAERTFGWSREEAIGRPLADTIVPRQHREAHLRGLKRFLSTGEGPVLNKRFEITALHRDGHEFPIELTVSAREALGCQTFDAFLHDITERKQADEERQRTEDALRKRELQLAHAQRVARIGSWEWDIAENQVAWSDELYRIFGLSRDRFGATYEAVLELVHPDDRDHMDAGIRDALDRRASFEFEHRVIRGDGATRILQCHGEVLTDAALTPIRMVGTCQDVTERRRAEEQNALVSELALSIGEAQTVEGTIELTLRAICERTGWDFGQAWAPAPGGSFLECSAAWFTTTPRVEAFRKRSESMTFGPGIGLPGVTWSTAEPVWMADVRSHRAFRRSALAREVGLGAGLGVPVLAGEEVVAVLEFFVFEPCPEDEDLVDVVSAAAGQLGFLIRRKQAEAALRKSEERFRLLVENVRDYAIVMLDRSGHVASWNQGAERTTGYSAEEIVGYHVSRLYAPDAVERGEPERHLEHAARDGRYEGLDWRVRRDGLRFWASVVITPLYDGEELRGFSYVTQDVSDQKQANEELRRLSAIVEHSEDAIISTTSEKNIITSWNPGADRLFGYSAREAIGRSIAILIPPEQAKEHKRILDRVRAEARPECHETEALRKNKSRVEVSLTASPIKDVGDGVAGISLIARDVTDRRRAERYLEQAFGTYLDPEVADHILREGPSMDAKEADVTMMFMDIRDFTTFAEQYEAREVVATLNCLFELAVPIITSRGGHVDKFVGDGLLATFGVPEPLADHADRALEAALEIESLAEREFQGDLALGIGIDSGTVIAGNVGGGGRLDFTVIGDAVNMASRVEAATRCTGDMILISERTKALLQYVKPLLVERRTVAIKGKQRPVALYAPSNGHCLER
jgi:PAS domain S-box-containing protein